MGTIIPALGNAVFGYRPIIIGFLHLVFLGFVSFYIFFNFLEAGVFAKTRISTAAIWSFIAAVTLNETILLIEGVGLMFYFDQSPLPVAFVDSKHFFGGNGFMDSRRPAEK